MHFSIDRTVHTTAFDKPVVDHWLERKIAQTGAGSTEKDRSDDRPLQRRARYRLSYIPLFGRLQHTYIDTYTNHFNLPGHSLEEKFEIILIEQPPILGSKTKTDLLQLGFRTLETKTRHLELTWNLVYLWKGTT